MPVSPLQSLVNRKGLVKDLRGKIRDGEVLVQAAYQEAKKLADCSRAKTFSRRAAPAREATEGNLSSAGAGCR